LPSLDKQTRNLIDSNFDNPNTYFEIDGFVLNKVVKGPKLDSSNKVIPYSFVGTPDIFVKKAHFVRNTDSNISFNRALSRREDGRKSIMKKNNILNISKQYIESMYNKLQRTVTENDVIELANYRSMISAKVYLKT
jgi:hypothetical protein